MAAHRPCARQAFCRRRGSRINSISLAELTSIGASPRRIFADRGRRDGFARQRLGRRNQERASTLGGAGADAGDGFERLAVGDWAVIRAVRDDRLGALGAEAGELFEFGDIRAIWRQVPQQRVLWGGPRRGAHSRGT